MLSQQLFSCPKISKIESNSPLGNEGSMLYGNTDKSFTQFINTHNFQNEGRFIYGIKYSWCFFELWLDEENWGRFTIL